MNKSDISYYLHYIKRVAIILAVVFVVVYACDDYIGRVHDYAYESGYEQGYIDGHGEGYEEGYNNAYELGKEIGRESVFDELNNGEIYYSGTPDVDFNNPDPIK